MPARQQLFKQKMSVPFVRFVIFGFFSANRPKPQTMCHISCHHQMPRKLIRGHPSKITAASRAFRLARFWLLGFLAGFSASPASWLSSWLLSPPPALLQLSTVTVKSHAITMFAVGELCGSCLQMGGLLPLQPLPLQPPFFSHPCLSQKTTSSPWGYDPLL